MAAVDVEIDRRGDWAELMYAISGVGGLVEVALKTCCLDLELVIGVMLKAGLGFRQAPG